MNPKGVGEVAEAFAIAKFLEKGWRVLKPIGDNAIYDCVLDRGNGFEKVQIKSSTLDEDRGVIICATRRHHNTRTKAVTKLYTKEEIDFFGVYNPKTRDVYLVPIEVYSGPELHLRVTESKNGQMKGVKWAKDFVI